MDAFSYSSLPKLTSMRLLKIIEHDESTPLRCELYDVDLDSQNIPRYSALSYCWGDQTHTCDIVCNGKRLAITSNLDTALRMTRSHDPNEAIWVDQVCICQTDLKEKVQQLQVMTVIFQSAWTVIGWLGPEDPSTGLGIQQVRTVGDTYDYESKGNETPAPTNDVEMLSNHSTSTELYDSMSDDVVSWHAFSRFFDRPWFTRVWIVQEMLPPLQTQWARTIDAVLICGPHVVEWHIVFSAAKWAHRTWADGRRRPLHPNLTIDGVAYTNRLSVEPFFRMAYLIATNPVRSFGRYSFEVLELLRSFRNREATDARDKIFGLLGLSNFNKSLESTGPADRSEMIAVAKVPVDYTLTVLETYRNFARAHIDDAFESMVTGEDRWLPLGHPAHVLEILYDTAPRSVEPGWPSWVPDWRQEGIYGHIYFPITHPSRAGSATVDAVIHPHPDPNCLKVNGLILGRVAWTHEGHHSSQIVRDSDPRAVGRMIASRIGLKYKYGSKGRNVDPDSYRKKRENDVSRQSKAAVEPINENDLTARTNAKPAVSENKEMNFPMDVYDDEDERSDEELSVEVDTQSDEQEDTEIAFLWTLTQNQLPELFAAADFDSDEYANTKILYNILDVFRSGTPPDFTEFQIELHDRVAAAWKKRPSDSELEGFLRSCLCDRRLFFTDSGYIGIAHDDVQVGDDAAILFGMGTACVLRPVVTDNCEDTHELIGNAWIRGASHGEVVEKMHRNGEVQPGQPIGRPITLR